MSSRHLVDAAVSRFWYGIIGNGSVPPDSPLGMVGVTESSGMYGRPNVSYRAPNGWGEYDTVSWNWRAAWSYVTGGQGFKLGYQGTHMQYNWESFTNPGPAAIHVQRRRADVGRLHVHIAVGQCQQRGGALDLRAGSVDARTDDASGRPQVRPRHELGAGRRQRDRSDDGFESGARQVWPDGQRDRVQRSHAARRCGVRPVRQRQNSAESERRQVPRGGNRRRRVFVAEPGPELRQDRDSFVDRLGRRPQPSTAIC